MIIQSGEIIVVKDNLEMVDLIESQLIKKIELIIV